MRYYILVFLVMLNYMASATSWTFTVYNMSNTPVFTTNTFKSAAVGKHKHLWMGSTNQGLYRFNGLTWQKATILTNHNIRALYCSPVDSAIWVAQSGSSSGNTNGGVNRIADTLYNHYYWGNTLGAPTRVANGIWVDEANTAWSAHWPHTTPTLTGGGMGKFPTGSATGTAIYAGLPSGSYATDRRCLSIGEGPGEIWVGVDRSVAGGVAKSSYIAKYSYGGTFLDSITASNSPIPFSSQIGGVAARAIAHAPGETWVGLSSGGLAVYSAGEWTMIGSPIVPAGAAVNFQSIASDWLGRVYIGTTAGLLVYNLGDLLDPNNWELFTTVNGLPSNNVTGVAIMNEDEIWLATSGGVVKMAQSLDNHISGYVKRTRMNYTSGGWINDPYPQCLVYLFENNVKVDSAVTDGNGFFSFTSLDIFQSYSLKILSHDVRSADIILEYTIQNAEYGETYDQIKIPYDIHVDLLAETALLPKQQMTFPLFFNEALVPAREYDVYDTAAIRQFERDCRVFSITQSHPDDEAVERVSRVLVEVMLAADFKDFAARMTKIVTRESFDLAMMIAQTIDLKELSPEPIGPINSNIVILLNLVNRIMEKNVKEFINNRVDAIGDAQVRNAWKRALNGAYEDISGYLEFKASTGDPIDLLSEEMKNLTADIFVRTVAPEVYLNYYVAKTAPALPEALNRSDEYPFDVTFPVVCNSYITSTSSRTYKYKQLLTTDSSYIAYTNSLAETSDKISEILDLGAQIFGLICPVTAGTSCAVAASLSAVGKTLQAMKFVGKGLNIGLSAQYVSSLKSIMVNSPNQIFDQTGTPYFGPLTSTSGLTSSTLAYNQKLTSLGAMLQSGNRTAVIDSVAQLAGANESLENQMRTLSKQVFSRAASVYAADSSFGDYLDDTFINNSLRSSMARQAFNYTLISYMIDSVANYADTLIAIIPGIIQRNNQTLAMYDSIIPAISGYPLSQPLLMALEHETQCNGGTSYPVTAGVQNLSVQPIDSVWALITVNNGVSCPVDSIFLGTIAAGQTQNALFYITTPDADTSGQIYITVHTPAGEAVADGSSLRISSGQSTISTLNNITISNGENQCFNASQTVTTGGNGSYFTVVAGGNAELIAGQKIFMKPGTRVYSGGYLHAHITPGGAGCGDGAQGGQVASYDDHLPSPIHSTTSNQRFRVYPNPTSGIFFIQDSGVTDNQTVTIEVFSLWGAKTVQQTVLSAEIHEVSLTNHPAGLYILRITAGTDTEVMRVIREF